MSNSASIGGRRGRVSCSFQYKPGVISIMAEADLVVGLSKKVKSSLPEAEEAIIDILRRGMSREFN